MCNGTKANQGRGGGERRNQGKLLETEQYQMYVITEQYHTIMAFGWKIICEGYQGKMKRLDS